MSNSSKYIIAYSLSFILLTHAQEPPCRVQGVAGTLDDRICELREFVNTIEKFTPEIKKKMQDKKEYYDFMNHNILFYSKPGYGKTTTCNQLAKELNARTKFYHAQELIDNPKMISQIYKAAEKEVESSGRPVVIFVDNIELFARVNDKEKADFGRIKFEIKSEAAGIVTKMDVEIANHEHNPYIVTVFLADLEHSSQIFNPLHNRFYNSVISWDLPNYNDRKEIIAHFAQKYGKSVPSWLASLMAYESYDATGKEIEDVFKTHNSSLKQCYYLFRKKSEFATHLKFLTSIALAYLGLRYGFKYYKHYHPKD